MIANFKCEFLKRCNYETILVWLLENASQLQFPLAWMVKMILNIESWMLFPYEYSPQFCLLPMVMAHHQLPHWHGNNLLPPWCRLFVKYKKIIRAAGMQKPPLVDIWGVHKPFESVINSSRAACAHMWQLELCPPPYKESFALNSNIWCVFHSTIPAYKCYWSQIIPRSSYNCSAHKLYMKLDCFLPVSKDHTPT